MHFRWENERVYSYNRVEQFALPNLVILIGIDCRGSLIYPATWCGLSVLCSLSTANLSQCRYWPCSQSYDCPSVDCYDPVANAWSTCADMSAPRNRVGVAVLDGMLYAVGGSNGPTHHRTVERFASLRHYPLVKPLGYNIYLVQPREINTVEPRYNIPGYNGFPIAAFSFTGPVRSLVGTVC